MNQRTRATAGHSALASALLDALAPFSQLPAYASEGGLVSPLLSPLLLIIQHLF
jgi:hypothetical protein